MCHLSHHDQLSQVSSWLTSMLSSLSFISYWCSFSPPIHPSPASFISTPLFSPLFHRILPPAFLSFYPWTFSLPADTVSAWDEISQMCQAHGKTSEYAAKSLSLLLPSFSLFMSFHALLHVILNITQTVFNFIIVKFLFPYVNSHVMA